MTARTRVTERRARREIVAATIANRVWKRIDSGQGKKQSAFKAQIGIWWLWDRQVGEQVQQCLKASGFVDVRMEYYLLWCEITVVKRVKSITKK